MEALVCKKLGDPTALKSSISEADNDSPIILSKTHPIPQLKSPTSVRVRVKATSLNYANYLQILGKYQEKPPLPFIPGSDYSGIVDAVGSSVSPLKAELFKVPDGCDLVAAGALPVAFGTSHVALVHRAQLTSGQVLLVLGAAGGVGLSAVQIGKVCGAVVIAVASKESVIASVKDFLKARKLKGVDVLYDPVGGKLTKESMKLLNWGAQILVIGFASGDVPVIPANIALVKASLAFAAIKDRKAIGKVMIAIDDERIVKSKL
ncbi:hypothetical protein H0E87_030680 [Populus deltoides]|uniref:Enoyl reductase (ER) domain-containing protein n=1 Tax=Populus deltoides TaxID=3696 RepID=A0A8T2WJG1_POPDE|nr:hypothetical protein H0E87_030680 [Populus deltoides]